MEHRHTTLNLPRGDEAVDQGMIRRPIRPVTADLRDTALSHSTVVMVMTSSVATLALFPQSFIFVILVSMLYYTWVTSRKFRLPFKISATWGGVDYGSVKPGGSGFNIARGILFLGVEQHTGEELWLEKGDACRHGFFIGTTGSGKALPENALILTPRGWVQNKDLRLGDQVCHPSGDVTRITSIHPQGEKKLVNISFEDGREIECCSEHLWQVSVSPKHGEDLPHGVKEETRLLTTADLGILHGIHGDKMSFRIPLTTPPVGLPIEGSSKLSRRDAKKMVENGALALDYMPSLYGTAEQRIAFFKDCVDCLGGGIDLYDGKPRLKGLTSNTAYLLKHLIWSLGGTAFVFKAQSEAKQSLVFSSKYNREFHPDAELQDPEDGLCISAIEAMDIKVPMSCIKVDRADGLFVMENYVVTHNTELLLGVVSQTLMWGSGFLFIDGKGTTEFYTRVWTLAKRFGREDDVRVLNFTDPGGDPDAPAGGPGSQSNTINPFAKGTSDQLMNIIVSLMGDAGKGNDMWKSRAISLVTAQLKALCELRDSGDIMMNVQTIRDFLTLGRGFDPSLVKNVKKIEDVPEEAWNEIKTRAGMIELYFRSLNNEFSEATKLALRGFFDTLPGFSMDKALKGQDQDEKCSSQYGFLSMQLTQPLGSLAVGYGHIFRTPLGEVDMDDIVLNRRILVVLLPALEKAEEEMQNCGKIIISLVKMMMANASGSEIQGTKQEIVDAKATKASTPFIVVADEAGYYMVSGIDVSMAQARSLNFMIIIAGQDMSAMKKVSDQIAETAAANASILAVGKTTDGSKTIDFVQRLFGKVQVSVSSGYQNQQGSFTNKWVDRMDATFQEVDRVKASELQNMAEGEFYFLFNGHLVRSATFFIGENFAQNFSVNKFLKVRGPTDKVPGLDQRREIAFQSSYLGGIDALVEISKKGVPQVPSMQDSLFLAHSITETILWRAGAKAQSPKPLMKAVMAGLIGASVNPAADEDAWVAEMDSILPDMDNRRDEDDEELTPVKAQKQELLKKDNLKSVEHSKRRFGKAPLDPPLDVDRLADHENISQDKIPAKDVADLASSLERITNRRPSQRYRGFVDMSVAEQQSIAQVKQNKALQNFIQSDEEKEQDRNEIKKDFTKRFIEHQDYSRRLSDLLKEQGIDGDLALAILRNNGVDVPIPLKSIENRSELDAGFISVMKEITPPGEKE